MAFAMLDLAHESRPALEAPVVHADTLEVGLVNDRQCRVEKSGPAAWLWDVHSDRERKLVSGEIGELPCDFGDGVLADAHLVDKRLLQFGGDV